MKYEKLLQLGKIGNLELKNRFIMGAMGVGFAKLNGHPTDRTVAYYEERAKGGYGLMDFSNRNEFWQYVSENDVSRSITETWWLVNNGIQYFTIDGTYDRDINRITVQIENKVYD